MPKAATYELVGVTRTGRTVHGGVTRGAPSDGKMCTWGRKRGALFVIRYYPSKRGWRLLDIRAAHEVDNPGQPRWWTGYTRSERVYRSMDGAIMHAIAILAG